MKKILVCMLLVIATCFAMVSCGVSIDDVKERLSALEEEYEDSKDEKFSFEKATKNEKEELVDELEDELDINLEGEVISAYNVKYQNEDGDRYFCSIVEFEKSSDVKAVEKEADTFEEMFSEENDGTFVCVREGTILFIGSEELINMILEK